MPKPLPERMINITVNYRGWISLLKVQGPVVHPITVTEKKALQLVMSGAEVIEHVKGGQTIKLTLENIRDPKRYAVANVSPTVVEKHPGVPLNKKQPDVTAQNNAGSVVVPPKKNNVAPPPPPHVEEESKKDPEPVTPPAEEPKAPEAPVEEVKEEAPAATEEAPAPAPAPEKDEPAGMLAKDYIFSYNKNGSVDETRIPWAEFSKNQRRLLRDRINEINAKSNMPKM